MILFKHFAKKEFELGGIVVEVVSPDSSSGSPVNPVRGDRAFEDGGKVESITETPKESPKETKKDSSDDEITAYCMATKTKNVVMHDVVVKKTSKGGYIAHGTDGKGHKMVAMLNKEKGSRLYKQ